MDILHLIKRDHETILSGFPQRSREAFVKKPAKLDKLLKEIEMHFSLEKDYLFPEVSYLSSESKSVTDIGLANHGIILRKIKSFKSSASRSNSKQETVVTKFNEIEELVRKHFQLEEQMLMPKIRVLIQTELREDLGHVLLDAKEDLRAGINTKSAAAASQKKRA